MSEQLALRENRKDFKNKMIWIAVLVFIVILLLTVARPILVNQNTYTNSYEYLDNKMGNATMLSLGATSASLVVTLLPDDAGTPIANELADFTGYLLLVMSAIFLERFLLTTIGFISSSIILPLACIFAGLAIWAKPANKMKLKEYAFRLAIFGICIVLIIPAGCICGREIEKANEHSIQMAIHDAENANEIVKSIPAEEQGKNIFDKVGDFFSNLWDSATEAYEWAKTVLSNFMSSIAVMMVTTIAIPVLMLFSFLWLVHFLTKRDFVIAVVGYAEKFADNTKKVIMSASRKPKKNNADA